MRYILITILFLVILSPLVVFAEDTNRVEIFAHHGVLEDVPENTFAALQRVAELGIDGIDGVALSFRKSESRFFPRC